MFETHTGSIDENYYAQIPQRAFSSKKAFSTRIFSC